MKQRERDEGMRRQGVDSKREKMNIESRIKEGGGNRWTGTDTPAEGKAEIMLLCGQLIGPEQYGVRRGADQSHTS